MYIYFSLTNVTMDKYYKIKGYEDYYITKSGKVYSTLSNKELKYDTSYRGYCKVKLMDRRLGKFIGIFVHRLVATQFIPNPRHLPEVNHKDGNHANNSVYNLEWCTSEYNHRHAVENGLYKIEEDNPRAKLTKEQVLAIYKEWETNKNKKSIAIKYNVSDALIGEIVRGVRWSRTFEEYYGYKPDYKKPKRKHLTSKQIYQILDLYYNQHKNTIQIEKEMNVSNSYVGAIVKGIRYSEYYNKFMQEINNSLDNQQPNLGVTKEVQRL